MSFRNTRHKKIALAAVGLLLGVFLGTAIFYLPELRIKMVVQGNSAVAVIEKSASQKKAGYQELSPDKSKQVIFYLVDYSPQFYNDYYEDYYPNQNIIAVKDMHTVSEDYIFTGNRIGLPHWLGNENIFFTAYCGTACQGLYLVNTSRKETRTAVLGYMYLNQQKSVYTDFKDWYGREFKFDGLADDISAETVGKKTWLIFSMKDKAGNTLGNKKFLFTGTSLVEE